MNHGFVQKRRESNALRGHRCDCLPQISRQACLAGLETTPAKKAVGVDLR